MPLLVPSAGAPAPVTFSVRNKKGMTMSGNREQHVDKKECFKWYGVGAFTGILAWLFGTSSIPTLILKYGSGVGYLLVFSILIAAVLLGISHYKKQPLDILIKYISVRSIKGSAKVVSFLSGSCTVSAVCWFVTGSSNALGFTIFGLLFIFAFSYFYWAISSLIEVPVE
ncbi:hypothetical protein ABIE59_004043 [Marinobacter sp. MBR-99]|uniref:hypothetical protein n=1 Tax=Marinobacter sp. MBR-99 TaxID=3156461 RepID=UPI003391C987